MIQFIQKLFDKRREQAQILEEERQAALAKQRAAYQARKKLIDDYVQESDNAQRKKDMERYERNVEKAKEENSTCPNCGSSNVINVFRRIKGELDGDISGGSYTGSSSGLFHASSFGSSHVGGNIHGELDTHQILKCKDCGNEWEKKKVDWPKTDYKFSPYSSILPRYFTRRLLEYFEMEYDPKDLNETAFSLEEKQKKYLEETRNDYNVRMYRGVPIEVLEWTVCSSLIHDWDSEEVLGFDYDSCEDPYFYRFPERVREVAEYLTKESVG